MIQLTPKMGRLYIPNDAITDELQKKMAVGEPSLLIYEHPGGDHDTIKWPAPNLYHLAGALYDAREMGQLPDDPEVLLPDGTVFNIELSIPVGDPREAQEL